MNAAGALRVLALLAVVASALTVARPTALAAQGVSPAAASGSVLDLLRVADRVAQARSELLGELRDGDLLVPTGQRVQAWQLEGREGERVRIDLTSNDFDAYLYLVGPGYGQGLQDDDGGSGLNSRLCTVLPASGTYRVVAAALGGGTGRYSLSIDPGTDAAPEDVPSTDGDCGDDNGEVELTDLSRLPTEGRVAEAGDEHQGVLPIHGPAYYGSPVEAWALRTVAGQNVTVDLRSTDFDAYLQLLGPGIDESLTDDDGAGGCDARITLAAPEEGMYRIIVSSLGSSGGAFTLSVHDDGAPPIDPAPCIPPEDTPEADEDPAVLPVSGTLELEDAVDGTLGSGGARWRGGPAEVWTVEGRAGQRIRIDHRSEDFDAFLGIHGPGFGSTATDDDGGDGLDSRLCIELPEDGTFRILAGTFSSTASGSYRLEVSAEVGASCGELTLSPEQRARLLAEVEPVGRLQPEIEVEGVLDRDDPTHPERGAAMEVWSLEGEAGERLTVDLVSDDFDAYLYLSGPGLADVRSDDDGAGCLDSRIAITFPESGIYRIVATGFGEPARGAYRVIATTDPEQDRECDSTVVGTATVSTVSSAILDEVAVPESRTVQRPAVSTLVRRTGDVRSQLGGVELDGRLVPGDVVIPEGRHAQGWGLEGREGDSFVIELLSDDFDANLYLDGPGLTEAFHDDDGAGSLDSRLNVTLPEDGTYRIVVTSNSGGEGAYTLRIVRRVGRGP